MGEIMITPIITDEMIPQILKNMANSAEMVIVTHKTAKDINAVGLIEEMINLPDVVEKWKSGQIAFIYPAIPTGHIRIVNIQ